MTSTAHASDRRSLREQVETLLPSWQSWYPSLFDAAEDLGLIRARVCSLSSLMLSSRHADVQNEAAQAFKEHWCVEDEPQMPDAIHQVTRLISPRHKHTPGQKLKHGKQRRR